MVEAPTLAESKHVLARWAFLGRIAAEGLSRTYHDHAPALSFTRRLQSHGALCHGHSVRYALISLLGLAKVGSKVNSQGNLIDILWRRIGVANQSQLSVGDLGLGLWAQALHSRQGEFFAADHALAVLRDQRGSCDSIELAWLLLGADHIAFDGPSRAEAEHLAAEAKHALLALYNWNTRLFYRHAHRGLLRGVSRRITCFANQIYPVMALAVHGRRTGCRQSSSVAGAVADNLCRLQGELGQWWWLYDVCLGQVVDGYPVFSVHQDGMAPMALLEVSASLGRCYAEPIERGLRWVFGANELGESLVCEEQGLVLRDIHRRGVGRARRITGGALWCCGWRTRRNSGAPSMHFEVNSECRPYHLGWILYAASLVGRTANPTTNCSTIC